MDEVSKILLPNHNHELSSLQMLTELKQNEEFSDVTLICDDKNTFKAHRMVLCSASPVLKRILERHPNNTHVMLPDVTKQDLECVLKFIYSGETSISVGSLMDFISTANFLEIDEIVNSISKVLEDQEKQIAKAFKEPKREHKRQMSSKVIKEEGEKVKREKTYVKNFVELEDGTRLFHCSHCQQEFRSPQARDFHEDSKHLGKRFPCDECGLILSSKSNLTAHKRNKHEGRRFSCDKCDYTCGQMVQLKVHMKRKYSCQIPFLRRKL